MIRSDVRIEALFLWSNSCLFLFLRSDNLTISCWHSSTDCDSSQISCKLAITIDITHGHDGVFLELKDYHFLVGWDDQSCGCEEMWFTESWLSPRGPQQKYWWLPWRTRSRWGCLGWTSLWDCHLQCQAPHQGRSPPQQFIQNSSNVRWIKKIETRPSKMEVYHC